MRKITNFFYLEKSGVGKTVGFEIDEKMQDPTYNWTETKETRIEYMDNIEQQYTYFCYGEKDYEACQKRAEFLMNFRQKYELAQEEFVRCCETFKTPGCCNQAILNLKFLSLINISGTNGSSCTKSVKKENLEKCRFQRLLELYPRKSNAWNDSQISSDSVRVN